MLLPFKVGTLDYERAVNSLRAELNFLDASDAFASMQFNMKVLALLGPGDHWLLRRITEGDLHGRSLVASGTVDEILLKYHDAGHLCK